MFKRNYETVVTEHIERGSKSIFLSLSLSLCVYSSPSRSGFLGWSQITDEQNFKQDTHTQTTWCLSCSLSLSLSCEWHLHPHHFNIQTSLFAHHELHFYTHKYTNAASSVQMCKWSAAVLLLLFSLCSPPLNLLFSHKWSPPSFLSFFLPPSTWLHLPFSPLPPSLPCVLLWPHVCFSAGKAVRVKGHCVQTHRYWHTVGAAQRVLSVYMWVSTFPGNQSLQAETLSLLLSEDERGRASDHLSLSLSHSLLVCPPLSSD